MTWTSAAQILVPLLPKGHGADSQLLVPADLLNGVCSLLLKVSVGKAAESLGQSSPWSIKVGDQLRPFTPTVIEHHGQKQIKEGSTFWLMVPKGGH